MSHPSQRPLFRVHADRDVGMFDRRIVPFNDLDVGVVDFDYRLNGRPAVRFEPLGPVIGPPNPQSEAYMQIGYEGYWPLVKVRYAAIVAPNAAGRKQGIFAALRTVWPVRFLAQAQSGRPRDPGHYFLEGEAVFQSGPRNGVSLYFEGAATVLENSYVEITVLEQ